MKAVCIVCFIKKNENNLISCGMSVKIWNLDTLACLKIVFQDLNIIRSVSFYSADIMLYVCAGMFRFYSLKSGKQVAIRSGYAKDDDNSFIMKEGLCTWDVDKITIWLI